MTTAPERARCPACGSVDSIFVYSETHDDLVCQSCRERGDRLSSPSSYNDTDLPDDPFEAGQQLAELFRQTAEAL